MISYIHKPNAVPAFTLGYKIIKGSHLGCRVLYAVAFCSHKDQFNKKLGRRIVDGRLAAADHKAQVDHAEVVFIPLPEPKDRETRIKFEEALIQRKKTPARYNTPVAVRPVEDTEGQIDGGEIQQG